jgi:hypothetical protein
MLSKIFTRDDWEEFLSLYEILCSDEKDGLSETSVKSLITFYSILGEIFDETEFKVKSNSLFEPLSLIDKLYVQKNIVQILHKNQRFNLICLDYSYQILDKISSTIEKSEGIHLVEDSAKSSFLLILTSVFDFNIENLYDQTLKTILKIIQSLPREDQIISYYDLINNLIEIHMHSKAKEIFQIAEEMYNSANEISSDYNNYPIMQIRLEQALKEKNTNLVIKLFNYFINNTKSYSKDTEIFTILDYLHIEGHNRIFNDFLSQIIDKIVVKEENKTWIEPERKLSYRKLSIIFEKVTQWNSQKMIEPLKSMLISIPSINEPYWDIRLEFARIYLGLNSQKELTETILNLTKDYSSFMDKFLSEQDLMIAIENFYKSKDFYPMNYKIINILQGSKYFENPIQKIVLNTILNSLVILIKKFSGVKLLQHAQYGQVNVSDFKFLFFRDFDLDMYMTSWKETNQLELFNVFFPIWKDMHFRKVINNVLGNFSFRTSNYIEFLSNINEFKMIVDLLVELEDKILNDNKIDLIKKLDDNFKTLNLDFKPEILDLLERKTSPSFKFNIKIEDQYNKPNVPEAIFCSLFIYYCKILIDLRLLENSEANDILHKLKDGLPNFLKLEFSLIFAHVNKLELSTEYLNLFLKTPSIIAWKLDDSSITILNPSLNVNTKIFLTRIQTLINLDLKNEAITELLDISKLLANFNMFTFDTLNDILYKAIILDQRNLIDLVIKISIDKLFKEISKIEGRFLEDFHVFFEMDRPVNIKQQIWREIILNSEKIFENKFTDVLENPLSVNNLDMLFLIIKYLIILGNTIISLKILNIIDRIFLTLILEKLPQELLKKFPAITIQEKANDLEINLFSNLLKESSWQIPGTIRKKDSTEIDFTVLDFCLNKMVYLYKKAKMEEKFQQYQKIKIEFDQFYENYSYVFKNRVILNKFRLLRDSLLHNNSKELLLDVIELFKIDKLFKNNYISEIESILNQWLDLTIENA